MTLTFPSALSYGSETALQRTSQHQMWVDLQRSPRKQAEFLHAITTQVNQKKTMKDGQRHVKSVWWSRSLCSDCPASSAEIRCHGVCATKKSPVSLHLTLWIGTNSPETITLGCRRSAESHVLGRDRHQSRRVFRQEVLSQQLGTQALQTSPKSRIQSKMEAEKLWCSVAWIVWPTAAWETQSGSQERSIRKHVSMFSTTMFLYQWIGTQWIREHSIFSKTTPAPTLHAQKCFFAKSNVTVEVASEFTRP